MLDDVLDDPTTPPKRPQPSTPVPPPRRPPPTPGPGGPRDLSAPPKRPTPTPAPGDRHNRLQPTAERSTRGVPFHLGSAIGSLLELAREFGSTFLQDRKDDLIAAAAQLQVTDASSYQQAAELASTFQGMLKEADAHFDPDIQKAHQLHRSLLDKKQAWTNPLNAALDALKTRARAWKLADDARIAEARRAAEAEERRRRDADEARLRAEAAAAQQAGQLDRALDLVEEARAVQEAPPPPAPVSARPVTAAGMSHRARWTFEVTDKLALIRAVAAGSVSPEALQPNDVYLRARAQADKTTVTIPGVRIFDAGTTSVRSRR